MKVAPSRVRELKRSHLSSPRVDYVAPSRVRELKLLYIGYYIVYIKVAPSRVRELKHNPNLNIKYHLLSHPHGCVS